MPPSEWDSEVSAAADPDGDVDRDTFTQVIDVVRDRRFRGFFDSLCERLSPEEVDLFWRTASTTMRSIENYRSLPDLRNPCHLGEAPPCRAPPERHAVQ
jgi:hypothetical protein